MDEIVQKDAVTIQWLHKLFDDAYMKTSIDKEGDLMVQGSHKIWVEVDGKQRFVRFMSAFNTDGKAANTAILEYVNLVNTEQIFIRANALKNTVIYDYYLWMEGGVTRKNFVFACKEFEVAVEAALEKDKANLIL
ncbi:MAG TPA: YbjN domain-containing protein [bacterium]|nr:YbjN domain-containing protein [bacterium]HPG81865.1 YbjN domain-containing protein [bacterium]HPM58177.1 YbjN domain-containing protein [bacterium]